MMPPEVNKSAAMTGKEGVSPGGWGAEGTLILSYMHRLRLILGFQILNFNILVYFSER